MRGTEIEREMFLAECHVPITQREVPRNIVVLEAESLEILGRFQQPLKCVSLTERVVATLTQLRSTVLYLL